MANDRRAGGKKPAGSSAAKKRGRAAAPPLDVAGTHRKPVTALAFAPDGRTLVSGGEDRAVRLWDAASGEPCACGVMGESRWGIAEVSFAPDGRAVAAVGRGVNEPAKGRTKAYLWDLVRRKAIELRAEGATLRSPAFAPDGRLALVGGGVRLFDADGRETAVLPQGNKGDALACSPDGAWAVFGDWLGALFVLDVARRKEARRLEGHADSVTALAFSPDGRWLASSSSSYGREWEPRVEDRSVRVWDFEKGEQLRSWSEGWDTTTYLAFLADGRHLVSFHDPHGEARLVLRSVEADEPVASWSPPEGTSAVGVWSGRRDGEHTRNLIATGHRDGTVRVWDFAAVLPAPGIDPSEAEPASPTPAKRRAPAPKKGGQKVRPTPDDYDEYFRA